MTEKEKEYIVEKLQEALEEAENDGYICAKIRRPIVFDAIALLKEQEAVEPKRIDRKRNHFIKCGNCNYDLLTGYLFCPHCGRKVNWE